MSKAKEELAPATGAHLEAQKAELWMRLGAIRAADSIAATLDSQTIRSLQHIRDAHLYRALGFTRFDDFLESDQAPMNYSKFNRLEKAIEREGDELFDFFNSIEAPLAKRRLLGKGDVRVEGREMVAQVEEDEIRVPLNNTTRILNVLTRITDRCNEQARKIRRGESRNRSLHDQVKALKNSNGSAHVGRNDFYDAKLNVIGSFSVLAAEAEKLPEDQRAAQREAVYDMIGEHMKRLDEAFGLKVPESVKKRTGRVPKNLVEDNDE